MAPYTYPRNRKPIVEVAIAGFVLATLFCMLYAVAAEGCPLFHNVAWVALELLRPAIQQLGSRRPNIFVRGPISCSIYCRSSHPSGRCFGS